MRLLRATVLAATFAAPAGIAHLTAQAPPLREITVTSSAFKNGEAIPSAYAGGGKNR